MTPMSVLVVLLTAVVALLAVLVAGLLRSHAEILRALHDLGAGLDPGQESRPAGVVPRPRVTSRPAVDVSGTSPEGDAVSVAVTEVDHPTLLAFLTSGCTTCVEFWNAFADPRSLRVPGGARLVVVTKGEEAESPGRLRKFAPRDVPVVMSSAAWDDYDVPVAPYFAYVDGATATVVGEGAAGSWNHLSDMLAQALADAGFDGARTATAPIGREPGARRTCGRGAARGGHRAGRPEPLPPTWLRAGLRAELRGRRGSRRVSTAAVITCGIVVAVVAAIRSSWSP